MHAFAILGSHKSLSLAEINVVTGQTPSHIFGDVAIFDSLSENLETLNATLGGVQKLGVILGSVPDWNHDNLTEFLAADLLQDESSIHGKISFGFSVYGKNEHTNISNKQTQALGIAIKRALTKENHSARYVISKEPILSSIILATNHLLTRGAEYCFFVTPTNILIGKTVAVQDAQAWSARDFGRPRRNAKQGMLPPKLARMMLNLSGTPIADQCVFDPFCGSGTILMEAALLGASSLIGSDIHEEAVADTKENLAWLQTECAIRVPRAELFHASAQTVSPNISPNSVSLLVTETYLGRPRKGTETKKEVEDAVSYVANLYREAFSALLPVLKKDAVLVVAAPVHFFEKDEFSFDVRAILEPLGYSSYPLPYEPLVYRHQNQFVGRRIWRFKKS